MCNKKMKGVYFFIYYVYFVAPDCNRSDCHIYYRGSSLLVIKFAIFCDELV